MATQECLVLSYWGVKQIFTRILVFWSRYLFLLAFRHSRVRKPITKWDKHRHMPLAAKENVCSIDITVYMEIERNPGPLENSDNFQD